MARFAQLESEQDKPTGRPKTNESFERSASDLLTLFHKDLAAVTRTKGLKEDASSNWAGFSSTKNENKGTNCISPLFFGLFSLTLPIAIFLSWLYINDNFIKLNCSFSNLDFFFF